MPAYLHGQFFQLFYTIGLKPYVRQTKKIKNRLQRLIDSFSKIVAYHKTVHTEFLGQNSLFC